MISYVTILQHKIFSEKIKNRDRDREKSQLQYAFYVVIKNNHAYNIFENLHIY